MVAPEVEVLIVTFWLPTYVPAAGLKVGAFTPVVMATDLIYTELVVQVTVNFTLPVSGVA